MKKTMSESVEEINNILNGLVEEYIFPVCKELVELLLKILKLFSRRKQ